MSYNNPKIVIWNARGIRHKQIEFFDFLQRNKIDIALITETWLTSDIRFSHVNYACYRQDRESVIGGGVAILINKNIKHSIAHMPKLDVIEALCVEINVENSLKFKICSAYFPGRRSTSERKILFRRDILKLFRQNSDFLIGGDLNCRHQSWGCLRANCWGNILNDILATHSRLSLLNTMEPTYIPSNASQNPSTLDVFITNTNNLFSQPIALSSLSSDHLPVCTTLNISASANSFVGKYKYAAANWNRFRSYISNNINIDNLSLSNTNVSHEIDKHIEYFIGTVTAAADNSIPKTSAQCPQAPSLPQYIIHLIRLRNSARRKWIRYRQYFYRDEYVMLNSQINNEISMFRNRYWNSLLSSFSKGSKPFWKVAKVIKKKNCNISPLKSLGTAYVTQEEKAHILAKTFADNHLISANLSDIETSYEVEVSIAELARIISHADESSLTNVVTVKNIINETSPRKSVGLDNISNRLLKALPPKGIRYLVFIFNACLRICYFPKEWKTAKVIPIAKPGKPKDNPLSYRPISLLSSIGKILEKIIKRQLLTYIETNEILPKEQFGFRCGHSTSHQVLRIKNHIQKGFNLKCSTGLVLLDIEKAFDTVWHDALVHKMYKFGFPTALIKIVQNFLQHRFFAVHIGNVHSSLQGVPFGVPQGSVLGPVLFNIYISDIPNLFPNTHLAMFADDTAIYSSSILPCDILQCLQNSLHKIEKFFHRWKIKANPNKSQAVFFTRRRKQTFFPTRKLNLYSEEIDWSNECKYLGLVLDSKLTFEKHVSKTIHKINLTIKILYPFINRRSGLSIDNKIIIFKTIFLAILSYGSPVWCDCANTHLGKLQICQNKILKMMLNLPWHFSTRRLHKRANVNFISTTINKLKTNFFEKCRYSDNELIQQLIL